MTRTPDYQLRRDAFGRLVLTGAGGETHAGVVPVRAFPIAAPDQGIALVDPHGHELAWIDRLSDLPDELRTLVEAELASREFMPVISRIAVSYTHLDVYKRQTVSTSVWCCRSRSCFSAPSPKTSPTANPAKHAKKLSTRHAPPTRMN